MNIREFILPVSLGVALLVLFASSGCEKGAEKEQAPRPEVRGVEVDVLTPSITAELHEAAGTVRARYESTISSRVMGAVTSIRVEEGDRVRRGQVLLTIDDRDIREKVRAAEQAHTEALRAMKAAEEQAGLAEKTYLRYRQLYEKKALTAQELDNVETRRDVAGHELERARAAVSRAEAGLREARIMLGFATVRSPLDGVVTGKLTDTGSMASPGKPLLTVENDTSYRIEVDVDERYLKDIKPGMKAGVHIASLNGPLSGTVAEVAPRVQPETRTFRVKVDITNGALRSGLYGKVRFPVGTKEALLVPEGAVVRKGQLAGVYTVGSGGLVTYRLVRLGREYGDGREVLSGLRPGERVIVAGVMNAVDGGILKEAE